MEQALAVEMKLVGVSEDGERIQLEVALPDIVTLRLAMEEYENELTGYVELALTSPNHADAEGVRRTLEQVKDTRKRLEECYTKITTATGLPF
jgi:UPF0288 family protein (methanogenesis marker protein 3)